MKTPLPEIIFSVLSVLASGCIGISDRTSGKIEHLYQPTCEDAELVAIPFRDGSKMSSEGRIAKAYCTVILPLTVVDLPFEVVFDTVFVPWDAWEAGKRRKGDSGKGGSEETTE